MSDNQSIKIRISKQSGYQRIWNRPYSNTYIEFCALNTGYPETWVQYIFVWTYHLPMNISLKFVLTLSNKSWHQPRSNNNKFNFRPCYCAEPQGPERKSCVPLVLVADGDDAQEEEDDAIRERAHGFHGILDSCVTLLGNVGECISLLGNTTTNLGDKY